MNQAKEALETWKRQLDDQLKAFDQAIRNLISGARCDELGMAMPALDLPAEVVAFVLEAWRDAGWGHRFETDARHDVYLIMVRTEPPK